MKEICEEDEEMNDGSNDIEMIPMRSCRHIFVAHSIRIH
jgi:hypothetical protein